MSFSRCALDVRPTVQQFPIRLLSNFANCWYDAILFPGRRQMSTSWVNSCHGPPPNHPGANFCTLPWSRLSHRKIKHFTLQTCNFDFGSRNQVQLHFLVSLFVVSFNIWAWGGWNSGRMFNTGVVMDAVMLHNASSQNVMLTAEYQESLNTGWEWVAQNLVLLLLENCQWDVLSLISLGSLNNIH